MTDFKIKSNHESNGVTNIFENRIESVKIWIELNTLKIVESNRIDAMNILDRKWLTQIDLKMLESNRILEMNHSVHPYLGFIWSQSSCCGLFTGE